MRYLTPFICGLVKALLGVIAFSFLFVLAHCNGLTRDFWIFFPMIVSGPIGGWIGVSLDGGMREIIRAWWVLLPATLLPLAPLVLAYRDKLHQSWYFPIAAFLWLVDGLIFGAALWR
jgi:hypothetical protein